MVQTVFIKLFEIALASLYIGATYHYIRDFIKPTPQTAYSCRVHISGLPILHLIYLIVIALVYKRNPAINFVEFLSVLALGLLIIYFYLERRFKTRTLGPWIVGLAAFLQVIVAIFVHHTTPSPENLQLFRSFWFALHMVFGALAYASLLISAVFSIMHLVLYRSLKKKKFGLFFERFLPLSVLGEMNYEAMVAGVILLALMIPVGVILVFDHFGKWIWDFKYLTVFISFLLYLTVIIIGRVKRLRGNRLAMYSLASAIILIATALISMLVSTNHRWL
jgi:ABC-type uncharacterized transport system permease subunit